MNSLMRSLDPMMSGKDDGVLAPMDVYETDSELVIELDLPGVALEKILLTQLGSVLVLEVTKEPAVVDGEIKYICLERHFGRFRRTVKLPEMVDGSQVKAEFKKGVLRIVCPKAGERRIQVQGD